MEHEQHLQQGNLDACLESIQNQIRSDASNVKHRIFLFQLLVVLGDWDRASKQLDVIAKMDVSALAMVAEYRAAIQCEQFREDVFSGKQAPVFMGEPQKWQALILQSLRSLSEDNESESTKIRLEALEMAPTSTGTINGDSFEWIADADTRLGPLLEVFVEGQYRWVPFTNIKRIAIEAPENLRDFIWMPAHIQWETEGESFVLIPSRYPFSADQNADLALSRKTEWVEKGEGSFIGFGQKIFATDSSDYSLLDVRDIFFEQNADDDSH
ncbi:type VI secretion system accessory protein TagJ [Cocleimonas sp. KMM 6892]|uniref:type VI secretion system accessory protein TagJ n=1 Tax=unclassified Cocleimonas TaxID=2639732 RepID=UPI002DBACA43|nr:MULTISPECIES: type VI secretion system accessory protein TagJ [unclassified Cocleimonas]MEB8434460.1 type VI secretion system accessory protein TagJ [Cocleimonas sp. KMM 6892]MEC4717353.1 type VI secretion system accessory protein TagJ [Cocleimonas sp. KMM 6895]MEC4746732.1 type VI secretion system accessory protein TagJ [Cocleimonas sp. KMM 6896]